MSRSSSKPAATLKVCPRNIVHAHGAFDDLISLAFNLEPMLINSRTGLKLPFERVSQESFPLPTLGSKLKALAKGLVNGVGFLLIRGLDPKQFSNEANLVMYLGVSAYIGEKRGCQDELGNMLRTYPCSCLVLWQLHLSPRTMRLRAKSLFAVHLTDLGAEAGPDNERQAPYSNVAQVSTASSRCRYAVAAAC